MTIHKSIRVERPPATAFKAFCEEIGQWWPKGPSFNGKDLADMCIEGRIGGRFYERYSDGTEYDIGQVTAYQPPGRVAFTWRAPSWEVATQVEVRFIADGAGTRVELEHSGWVGCYARTLSLPRRCDRLSAQLMLTRTSWRRDA